MTGLYQRALGPAWDHLAQQHRDFHSFDGSATFAGRAQIDRGRGWIARLAALVFRFPPSGRDVPVHLTKTAQESGEHWMRDFGGRRMGSVCTRSLRPGHSRERLWPCVFEMALEVRDEAMHLHVRRGWVLGIPFPKALLPRVDAKEFIADGRFNFDIAIYAPLNGGLLVHYRGWLARSVVTSTGCLSNPGG